MGHRKDFFSGSLEISAASSKELNILSLEAAFISSALGNGGVITCWIKKSLKSSSWAAFAHSFNPSYHTSVSFLDDNLLIAQN